MRDPLDCRMSQKTAPLYKVDSYGFIKCPVCGSMVQANINRFGSWFYTHFDYRKLDYLQTRDETTELKLDVLSKMDE